MATATAASSSRLSLRRAVSSSSSSQLRLPVRPPSPPRRLSSSSSSSPAVIVALHKRNPKRLKYASQRQFTRGDAGMLRVQVEPSGEDLWKLDPVIDLINRGAVGIIPTDTVYAIVCDLSNNDSVERLRRIKGIGDSKPLSILCRSLRDIDTYTTGFPRGTNQGQANIFRAVKRVIPGPYTFILPATKELPKQCIRHGSSTRYAKRRQVGVRLPDDTICEAILQNLDEPLICTSVKSLSEDEWILDPVIIADIYEQQGLDFIVDGGTRIADPSTVVDMTGSYPTVIRQGKGPRLDWMVAQDEEQESPPTFAFKTA
uniref:Threonylcarbamoyl-AMP synthase n=2 Tax=Oryza brachyantha TaxID=4533 RepID=J3MUQ0_ORYBR